jgi:hypothetical protein
MDDGKKAWDNVKQLLEVYQKGDDVTTEYVLKTLMFAIAFIAENEYLTPTTIAKLQDQVRNEVRIMRDEPPIVYYAAEA